jgi:hypothetical protein
MLNITPQERDVLAELIRLDNEYAALPQDKRGKFILSTDMRKEIREELEIEEKQFNVIISRLKKKLLFNKPLLGDDNSIHQELLFTPDEQGFRIEVNFVNTITPPKPKTFTEELDEQILAKDTEVITQELNKTHDIIMEHAKAAVNASRDIDASKVPVLEEEEFDISINLPDE